MKTLMLDRNMLIDIVEDEKQRYKEGKIDSYGLKSTKKMLEIKNLKNYLQKKLSQLLNIVKSSEVIWIGPLILLFIQNPKKNYLQREFENSKIVEFKYFSTDVLKLFGDYIYGLTKNLTIIELLKLFDFTHFIDNQKLQISIIETLKSRLSLQKSELLQYMMVTEHLLETRLVEIFKEKISKATTSDLNDALCCLLDDIPKLEGGRANAQDSVLSIILLDKLRFPENEEISQGHIEAELVRRYRIRFSLYYF